MNAAVPPADPQPEEPGEPRDHFGGITTYVFDSQDQLQSVDSGDGRGPVPVSPSPRLFRWEHLAEKRLFALTDFWDGKTEYWRDNPTRYLVVEIDDETGEVKPAVKDRKPVYLWLCREEREAH